MYQKDFNLFSACSVCQTQLGKENVSLISKQESKLVFHAACPKCKTATLISLTEGQKGLLGIWMMTDLDKNEAREKLQSASISTDEMIEAYETLKK